MTTKPGQRIRIDAKHAKAIDVMLCDNLRTVVVCQECANDDEKCVYIQLDQLFPLAVQLNLLKVEIEQRIREEVNEP